MTEKTPDKTKATRGPRRSLAEKAVDEYQAARSRADKKVSAAKSAHAEWQRLNDLATEAVTEMDFWASHPAVKEHLGETEEFEKEGTGDGDDA